MAVSSMPGLCPTSIAESASDAELFVRGVADRHKDVPADVRGRIEAWCVAELGGSGAATGPRPWWNS